MLEAVQTQPEINPHEAMMQSVALARQATQEAGQLHVISRVAKSGDSKSIRSMGDEFGPHLVHKAEKFSIPSNKHDGATQNESVVGKNEVRGPDSQVSTYESSIEWKGDRAKGSDSAPKAQVKVSRVDSKGESYVHTFKNPDTARKFNALIASQTIRRTNPVEAHQKAA